MKCQHFLAIIAYQNSMIKLHSGGIFEEILEGRREGQQIIRNPSICHLREGVINKPSIQTSDKGTCVKVHA